MSTADESRYLAFSLGPEKYAIPLLSAQEVVGVLNTTPVPFAPGYFKGLMNLHGRIVSVIDLRMKFKLPVTDKTSDTSIIVLNMGTYSLGVIVDSVNEVYTIDKGEIQPTPEFEGSVKMDFITGVIHRDEALILMIDIGKTLTLEDLEVLKRGAHSAGGASKSK
jgi:purine-binding chemotaxis protein CheW